MLNLYRRYKVKRLIKRLHKIISLQRKLAVGGIVGGMSSGETAELVGKIPDRSEMEIIGAVKAPKGKKVVVDKSGRIITIKIVKEGVEIKRDIRELKKEDLE